MWFNDCDIIQRSPFKLDSGEYMIRIVDYIDTDKSGFSGYFEIEKTNSAVSRLEFSIIDVVNLETLFKDIVDLPRFGEQYLFNGDFLDDTKTILIQFKNIGNNPIQLAMGYGQIDVWN